MFLLGVRTGFRISEILSLRLKDVVSGEDVAHSVCVQRKNMKGHISGREVPLHNEARSALRPLIEQLSKNGKQPETFLFLSREGSQLSRKQAWKILTSAYRQSGAFGRIGTHGMRKTFAARIYERLNHDLIGTQKALGHKSVNSTTSYLSFADDTVNKAILDG